MPKGRLNLVRLSRKILLFEFENPSEADRVLKFGRWSLRGYLLHLERWNQDLGCVRSKDLGKEVCVRVVSLPVHLWSRNVLKKIDNECGVFIAVDEDTTSLAELLWARILVKYKGRDTPKIVEVRAGSRSFLLQLWWEFPPKLGSIRAESRTVKQKRKRLKEDDECFPRAIPKKKNPRQIDGKTEGDVTKEAEKVYSPVHEGQGTVSGLTSHPTSHLIP